MGNSKAHLIRPRIDDFWVWKIKKAFPNETAPLKTMEQVVEFGLKMALEYSQFKKIGGVA